ncbi:GPI ethanolamine phosphate transferase 2 isoform X2 [Cryptomeria japonica]|uniref:GPI ethanolamine phosphate transferase 2 isoform X2 n=1 Tax=Cryptomeria japonica TaxID=3369 RepID=UPI0027DA481F|nr:GPI ethanolamine phosphate transferase 2 isoform X2 [Cryptomeria japonica]
MSSVTCWRVGTFTVMALVMQALGLFLFIIGFFPVKPALSGVSGLGSYVPGCYSDQKEIEKNIPTDDLRSLYAEKSGIPVQFDRIILMVIDGLPAEFVLGKGRIPPTEIMIRAMPHTQSLLSNGKAFGYHAKAAPPTVTMPRLKAMTSGAIAGFLDVAYNFNTQALLDDNILGQLARAGWQMVMHGDETWLKLFPGLFIRQDGVSSFYVKDTIEVDRNVSRHIEDELTATDWDLLIVVSDHGMNDGGNHGGSSFEETDSLALFIPMNAALNINTSATLPYSAFQVDIAPTLALLLGVPIPQNNIGVLLPHLFYSFTDDQKLRAMELNSWQLLRLLQARIPNSKCLISTCNKEMHDGNLEREMGSEQTDAKLCYLFQRAVSLHDSWRQHQSSTGEYQNDEVGGPKIAMEAYMEFLRTASGLLARGNTEKPFHLLAVGGFLMLGSLLLFLGISFQLYKAFHEIPECLASKSDCSDQITDLGRVIAILGIFIHVISLGASSLVEEEQYTWHFLLSTLCVSFIHRICQVWNYLPRKTFKFFWPPHSFGLGRESDNPNFISRLNCEGGRSLNAQQVNSFQVLTVIFVLITARFLRAWHQGGVNWTHLADISKWLDHASPCVTKSLQMTSVLLTMLMGFLFFLAVKPRKLFQTFVGVNILVSGFLISMFIIWDRDQIMPSSDYWPTLMARLVYTSLGLTTVTTLLAFPWSISLPDCSSKVDSKIQKSDGIVKSQSCSSIGTNYLEEGIRTCIHFVGVVYIFIWCLLQLLLQHPGNACPITVLLLQLFGMVNYFYNSGPYHKEWIMVITMYWLGMAGHFGLGNSNTLATVDVAGAYIGLTTHSTVLSGILLFIITYGSPVLFLFGAMLCSSFEEGRNSMNITKEERCSGYFFLKTIALPCVLPLVLNSVVLVGFTGVLVLMRNHLFVWSVFSPKYLYVCATTICIYTSTFLIAFTGLYSSFVIYMRSKLSLDWICL